MKPAFLGTIEEKAKKLAAPLRLGTGKTEFVLSLLKQALHNPCEYCGIPLNLHNMTVDHKKAFNNTKLRKIKSTDTMWGDARAEIDNKENLHIICTQCNLLKGEIDHEDYVALSLFLRDHPTLKKVLLKRLQKSYLFHAKNPWTTRNGTK